MLPLKIVLLVVVSHFLQGSCKVIYPACLPLARQACNWIIELIKWRVENVAISSFQDIDGHTIRRTNEYEC